MTQITRSFAVSKPVSKCIVKFILLKDFAEFELVFNFGDM